jgi:hypothetical protein
MKHIKPYKIFESNSPNFPTTREEVIQVCNRYGIGNYTINDDLSIDVGGSVYLINIQDLKYLPLRFNYVSGGFFCPENILVSLEGSPLTVGGNFGCGYNELKTLEGSPQTVNGDFNCIHNELETLEGGPQTVGGNFSCYRNELKDLEHFPEVNGIIDIEENTVNLLVYTFINKADSFMIEDFVDYEIVRNGDTVMLDRLQTFIRDNDLEMPDLDKIKEHYKIIE